MTATLVSVNVGMPRDHSWKGRTVYTGAWKDPVDGAAMVRRLGVEGDGQGDTGGHGGPNRAVLVYQTESYQYWRDHFHRDDLNRGIFAENLTVEGLSDTEVCIGDRYQIGEAEFEVSQPRVTCFRAGLRIGEPQLAALLVAHHRPGFYMRVLKEGRIQAGDKIVRTSAGMRQVSVAAVDALLYLPNPDRDTLRRAVDVPALSPGWLDSLRQLLDPVEDLSPAWEGFRKLQVTDIVRESATVSSVHLASPDGAALPRARPGQYLSVRVAGAVRSYSLSSAPGADTYRISVKREPHGLVSRHIHETVRAGAVLEVAAPRGDFVLGKDNGPVVLISAGVGITPVMAMLHRLTALRTEREVWWLHAARSPEEQAFAAEAAALIAELPHAHARTYYSGRRLSADNLTELELPANASAYICGPTGFMSDMTLGLRAAGIDVARIHTETFGALAAITPGIAARTHEPHQPSGEPGEGPNISFARSGISAPFNTDSLLEFAESCDVPARWSCRTGVCGTCATPLLSGEVDYSPAPLDKPAPGTVLLCCALPRTDLVLDM